MTKLQRVSEYVRIGCVISIVLLFGWIILNPQAPLYSVQRALVFGLGGVLCGLLFGGEVGNRLELKGRNFVLTLVGSAAVAAAAGYGLWWLAKPRETTVAFIVEGVDGRELNVAPDGVVLVRPTTGSRPQIDTLRRDSTFVITLSADEPTVEVLITPDRFANEIYRGVIANPESARARLKLTPDRRVILAN